jgi:hypothetical protein
MTSVMFRRLVGVTAALAAPENPNRSHEGLSAYLIDV